MVNEFNLAVSASIAHKKILCHLVYNRQLRIKKTTLLLTHKICQKVIKYPPKQVLKNNFSYYILIEVMPSTIFLNH